MEHLSKHLGELAHRGDALESVAYAIAGKSSKPTEADFQAALDENARFYNGSWPNIIRDARRVLQGCLASLDLATEALPVADELTPDRAPADQWKPRLFRLLARIGACIEPARRAGRMDARPFVSGCLPGDWPNWMDELRAFALELESVAGCPAAEPDGGKAVADPVLDWPTSTELNWPDDYDTDKRKSRFLDKHKAEIPNETRGQRRHVDANAFTRYWAEQRKIAFQSLGTDEEKPIVKSEIPTRQIIEGLTDLYQKANAKKQRK